MASRATRMCSTGQESELAGSGRCRAAVGDKTLPKETYIPVILANKESAAQVQETLGQA